MTLLKPKTRKVLVKELRRLVLKHGTALAAGLLSSVVAEFLAEALPQVEPKKKKRKK